MDDQGAYKMYRLRVVLPVYRFSANHGFIKLPFFLFCHLDTIDTRGYMRAVPFTLHPQMRTTCDYARVCVVA